MLLGAVADPFGVDLSVQVSPKMLGHRLVQSCDLLAEGSDDAHQPEDDGRVGALQRRG